MKIEKVEVFGVAVPLIGEYKNAYLSKTVQKSAVVRITACAWERDSPQQRMFPGISTW